MGRVTEEHRRNLPKRVFRPQLRHWIGVRPTRHMNIHLDPRMPTSSPEGAPHRIKLCNRAMQFNLMVARPVGRKEMTDNPLAKAAMKKEWDTLRTQEVWNLLIVRESQMWLLRLGTRITPCSLEGFMVYAWKRILNCRKHTLRGNSRAELSALESR